MALHSAVKGKLISVIGDEDTCVGFLLGGVGEINKNRHPNFMVVDKSKTKSFILSGNLNIYCFFLCFWPQKIHQLVKLKNVSNVSSNAMTLILF